MNPGAWRLLRPLVIVAFLVLPGCALPPREPAVPRELQDQALALNSAAIRTWDDDFSGPFREEIFRAGMREMELREKEGLTGPLPPAHYLAISGGGADGAYGAGMLNGWTAMGTRPEFKVVTGISTGALTAPFAFVGAKYDAALKKVYTSVNTAGIAEERGPLAAFYNDALMDTVPLRKLLVSLVNEEMMRDIAAEYAKGRILIIATTNLDANRGVIWNVGAIASSGDPNALTLMHDIMIASAAIPAAFPPVMIDVTVDGKKYQEMHVDGGAKAQVFLYPPTLHLSSMAASRGVNRDRVAYIIRNGRLDPQWADVQRQTLTIAGRAISSLIQTQGIGDLYRLYLVTRRDGVDFNLAYIPKEFNVKAKEDFDPEYMTELFKVGYDAAVKGYQWYKFPPGYSEDPPAVRPENVAPSEVK
ncbi:MAG: patatin-like phospholipase family protein [Phycisphaerales bacterium]|nr:patatin-like phospholipase family protein [Phycisphaerales bacterium]